VYFKSTFTPSSLTDKVIDPKTCLSSLALVINQVCEGDVNDAIKQLSGKRSAGPDKIPPYIFKGCKDIFVEPLCVIFNLCLANNVFPDVFKLTRVTPIFKSGDSKLISKYRPVAVLSTPSKIFEIIICKKIMSFLGASLSDKQHGFRSKKSIVTNMIRFTEYALLQLDNNSQLDVIFTDFSKAFDKVDHSLILSKMHHVGFSSNLVKFFNSYFCNRCQYVSYRGHNSDKYVVTSGVPQGSNLGPVLFNLFINDIVNCVKTSQILLYADDLKLYRIVNSQLDSKALQADLDEIVAWSVKNKIFFNISKCKVMTFTRKKISLFNDYSIDGSTLERVYDFKDLGLILDPTLNFNLHIFSVINKAYRNLGFIIRQSHNFHSISTLKSLYVSLVRSNLEFASIVWSPYFAVHINSIEKVQKKFLRYLYFKETGHFTFDIPHNQLLSIFEMESLEKRRKLAHLLFLFKLLRGEIMDSFCLSKINFYVPTFYNRSRNLFNINFSHTRAQFSSPLNTMMRLYNSLPGEVDIFANNIYQYKRYCLGGLN
jgi:hypothetical protein